LLKAVSLLLLVLPQRKTATTAESSRTSIFIGEFDSQPFELKNGDKILRMHPTNPRMPTWGGRYTVGQSSAQDFPMALGSDAGGLATVKFNLNSSQIKALTLRIGTTLSFQNGRPTVALDGKWTGADPGAPVSAQFFLLIITYCHRLPSYQAVQRSDTIF
jgi:rhamnogalacturonan endolyase